MMKSLHLAECSFALTLIIGFAALAAAEAPAPDYTRFSGVWILDKKASDDPAQAMAAERPDRGETSGRMGGGMHGGGGGMGGGRPGGQRGASSGNNTGARRSPQRMQDAIARMEIFLGEGELDITDGLDRTRLLSCDGKPKEILTEGGQINAAARLEKGRIIESWSGEKGPGRTITYSLEQDGSRLVVTEKRSRPGSDTLVTIRLVYTRQK